MTDKFVFEWDAHSNDFLHWMLPNLICGADDNSSHDLVERMSELTDKFKNVELGITINGVQMPAELFVRDIRRVINHKASSEALRLVEEKLPRLDALQDTVRMAERAMKNHIGEVLEGAGIELPYDWNEEY